MGRFASESLFDRLGRVVCGARCLPRKELFEAWELARRVRRLFRGGRIVDVAGGHGLLGQVLLLLDDSSSSALIVDPHLPASATTVQEALARAWPRLAERVAFLACPFEAAALGADDLVVSCHACGSLTDLVIGRAVSARARVAVMPCCHDVRTCDVGALSGWLDPALAIDATRAARLQARGYRVWTQSIPSDVTPKNRVLIGRPMGQARRS